MYDVEVVIKRQHALPFRVPGVADEERVKEIIESFMAAWGLAVPYSLRDTGVSMFADRLAEAGRYEDGNDDYHILVQRTYQPPTPYEEYRAGLRTR